jgi:capsular polysaccharide biosynthesis protein
MISDTEQTGDTIQLVKFLKKNLKMLFFYAVAGGALAFVLTFFMPKLYKSTGVVYPPSNPSIENSIDNPNFGFDIEADRLIQIFQSNALRDSVTQKFDLLSYYEIKKEDPEYFDKYIKKYKNDITFERSSSMSILISARTKDPELSANIVNYIIGVIDNIRENIYKQNIRMTWEHAEAEYNEQKSKTDSLQKLIMAGLSANNLNSLLLLASNSQISIDLEKLNASEKNKIDPKLGGEIFAFKNANERFKESESRLIKLKKILTTPVPKLFVIDRAKAHYQKVSPSFLTNILIGSFFALFTIVSILLFKSNFEKR